MPASAFIDTNIFVYQLDNADPLKQAIADEIIRDALANGSGCISYQVVQECLNVATRKAKVALDAASAGRYFDVVLEPLMVVPASMRSTATASRFRRDIDSAFTIQSSSRLRCQRDVRRSTARICSRVSGLMR